MAKAKKPNETPTTAAAKTSTAAAAAASAKKSAAPKAKAGAAAAGGKSSPAKAASPKAPVSKPGRAGGGATGGGRAPLSPLIDTNLAAQAAAKMLTAGLQSRNASTGAGTPAGGKPQSAMFKQLKEGLSKPHLSGMNSVLDKGTPSGTKRPDLPTGRQQVGHNQTFGADVNRAGVPRRTPG